MYALNGANSYLRVSVAQAKLTRFSSRAAATLAKRAASTHRVTVAALAAAQTPPPVDHDVGCVALASGDSACARQRQPIYCLVFHVSCQVNSHSSAFPYDA
jgi:hypothetical protein